MQPQPPVGDARSRPTLYSAGVPLSLYKNGSLIFSISMRPLNTVLRIDRTLGGAEIDKLIADLDAVKALAIEHRRRNEWRQRELSASCFRAECDHCHGLDQIGCGNRQHQ